MSVAAPARPAPRVDGVEAAAFTVPTDRPESDGTLEWDATTIVVVECQAEGATGVGYTYGDPSVAEFVRSKLGDAIDGADAMWPPAAWARMQDAIRNAGREGLGAMAVSAVDIALWDLKARIQGVCLADLLPRFQARVPVYGSGGFTSYSDAELRDQAEGWMAIGLPRVKVKVGREPDRDPERLAAVREVIGEGVELMVDANGAFAPNEALDRAEEYAQHGVRYLEEPVSSDDLDGMRAVRARAPAGMAIAAGEYGWTLPYFERMLEAGAVDILQADVTRCGGITNLLRVDGLAAARNMPLSAHCAPAVSAHACCALETLAHCEYFHDHVRIERMLFDGTLEPDAGFLEPDRSRPGHGLELRRAKAREFEL